MFEIRRAEWLVVLAASLSLVVACTGGPDPTGDGGVASSTSSTSSGSSGGSSSGASSGSTSTSSGSTASCSQFPVSGQETTSGGFSYVAEQKSQGSACACVTENPFGPDAGPAGTSCTSYKDCAMNCCTCSNSTRAFGAAVCQNGQCVDGTTACSLVKGVTFATDSLCP